MTVYSQGSSVCIDGVGYGTPQDTVLGYHQDSINKYISNQQYGEDDLFKEAIVGNKLMIMSDGSAKDGEGAAAWVITSEEMFLLGKFIKGSVKLPACNADSYRAECFGIYGGLWTLQQLLQQLHVTSSQMTSVVIQLGCDNISALQRGFDVSKHPVIGGRESDFDIIGSIRSLLPQLPTIQWQHVKGHQQGPILDIWSTLNNFADHEAGICRTDTFRETQPVDTKLPSEKWQIILGTSKLYKNLELMIYDEASRSVILPYWVKKDRFNQGGETLVNWPALSKAMQQSTLGNDSGSQNEHHVNVGLIRYYTGARPRIPMSVPCAGNQRQFYTYFSVLTRGRSSSGMNLYVHFGLPWICSRRTRISLTNCAMGLIGNKTTALL